MRMRFLSTLLLLGGMTLTLSNAHAQRRGGNTVPGSGTKLANVTVYTPDGKEFKTSSLRGGYTVLTFGCLT